jgi:tetratricopeptide (TPR) repeat protein
MYIIILATVVSLGLFTLPFAAEDNLQRRKIAWGALLLFALVLVIYRPILPGSFLMDDQRLIQQDNPLVNGQLTPFTVWFGVDFPLSNFALWLQWLAWGNHPGPYHAVNMALHALSAVLLWRLLARLKIPGAWLAAAIFAVHPVCVPSVGRIAEIKNTLSLPFFLLSFWVYLGYETHALYPAANQQPAPRRNTRAALCYSLSLIAFVLALFSKTSTVVFPVILLACAAWQRGRIGKKDLLHTSPYFFLAFSFGLMSCWFQKYQALAGQTLQPASFAERLIGAGRNFWFYLGKALLPRDLSIVYVHWKLDAAALSSYMPLLLLAVGFILCWKFRRTWGRHALFGLGCFAIALFPALGFVDAQYLVKFQVSDHLQYLPLIAVVTLATAALASFLSTRTLRFAALPLLLLLSVPTLHRAQVFATEESLWRDTLAKNPAAGGAHNDLGVILAKNGNFPEASAHFTAALRCEPDNADAHVNLGQLLGIQGRLDESKAHYATALQLKPNNPEAHRGSAEILKRNGKNREALHHLRAALALKPQIETRLDLAALLYQTGEPGRAVNQLRKVVSLKPDQPQPLNNLAWLLATCSDDTVRNGPEAVSCAERACRLTAFRETAMVGTLAAAYAEAGNFHDAVATAELAVRLGTAAGETRFVAISQQFLALYRAEKPWHETPAAISRQ